MTKTHKTVAHLSSRCEISIIALPYDKTPRAYLESIAIGLTFTLLNIQMFPNPEGMFIQTMLSETYYENVLTYM
ncbi:unnamed protein product [Colias eurytheme]|nr:unnamed protein product [Colias eurytheme]